MDNEDNSVEQICSNLQELMQVEKDARSFGFEWSDVDMIINQAISECNEISDSINHNEGQERIIEEIGDLLHTTISMSAFLGINLEQILQRTTLKFKLRMFALKAITKQQGLTDLKGQSTKYMLELWKQAKLLSEDSAT